MGIATEIRGKETRRLRMKRMSIGRAESLSTFIQEAVEKGSAVVSEGLQPYRPFPEPTIATHGASWMRSTNDTSTLPPFLNEHASAAETDPS